MPPYHLRDVVLGAIALVSLAVLGGVTAPPLAWACAGIGAAMVLGLLAGVETWRAAQGWSLPAQGATGWLAGLAGMGAMTWAGLMMSPGSAMIGAGIGLVALVELAEEQAKGKKPSHRTRNLGLLVGMLVLLALLGP